MSTHETMKYQPLPDGLHRNIHSNGTACSEYTLKNGVRHGLLQCWHENGQLAEQCMFVEGLAEGEWRHWNANGELLSTDNFKNGTGIARQWNSNGTFGAEFSYFRGGLTGRMRYWGEEGMLYLIEYRFEGRRITKKRYCELCNANPALPRFADEKIANTLGNYMRRMRREKREKAKLGPTEEDVLMEAFFDEQCVAESKSQDTKEVISWIEKAKRGRRELGELGRGETLRFTRKLYALGAIKVWATQIERDVDGWQYSKRLIVELGRNSVSCDRRRQGLRTKPGGFEGE